MSEDRNIGHVGLLEDQEPQKYRESRSFGVSGTSELSGVSEEGKVVV